MMNGEGKTERMWKRHGMMAVVLLCAAGCATTPRGSMTPTPSQFTFLGKDPQFRKVISQVYPAVPVQGYMVGAQICRPEGARIEFNRNSRALDLVKTPEERRRFKAGVYPFQVLKYKKPELSGAMVFYNIDKTLDLATLGMTEDKWILNEELVTKARAGVLAKYTMEFENRPVLTYWLGNRTDLYAGGPPTVEVDFSGTPGITSMKINGRKVDGLSKTLNVYLITRDPQTGTPRLNPVEYAIELNCGGKQYKGVLGKLLDNEFTAFVRIPCTIPRALLDAADKGTVARFVIMSEGDISGGREAVAEILVSSK
ncbi:MAG: hypothetical protein HN742_18930 [Lentisphaerae bacterium]|jgi:hypothetical protein|nr:hypothetical protein [Lentisphaerota bacterium]MBT7058242.1 hypothetical protein [Lentisphaerota bacterium]MBT7843961.1 hypothetical protein [Lentisphaerota bacterium]